MHVFTRPSQLLRLKVGEALLRSLRHSSLYRRLILANKEEGVRSNIVGQTLHKRLTCNPKEGNTLLKFIYGQPYNGKLANTYDHASADECPLWHKPDSCTHIARECPDYEAPRISRHNTACRVVHAAIRKAAKGGGALQSAPDLVTEIADAGTKT
jgi:hypothetical protein